MVVSALPDNTDQLICQPRTDAFVLAAGAPHCVSATVSRQLADSLSLAGVGAARQTVHISGCSKGLRHLDRVISAWLGWTADLLSLTGVVHGIHHREPACHSVLKHVKDRSLK